MRIAYGAFTFVIEARDIIVLPSYKGSTFRGGFGNAFRKIVCALRKSDCEDCILKEKCVYSYVFETPPPSDTKIMKKYKAAPHPFIIEPPPEKRNAYVPGDKITFGLTLIGRAIDYLPYFIYTFDELGKIGLGKGRGKYELKTVATAVNSQELEVDAVIPAEAGIQGDRAEMIYDSKTKTLKRFASCSLPLPTGLAAVSTSLLSRRTLSFVTPTRLVYDSHFVMDLEFHMLIRQLLRRLSLLGYFHCGADPSKIDFRGIIEEAEKVKTVERRLRWYDWERYSARQDERMKMGGFVGDVTFEGDIEPFMPLIRAGEVLHVGKGTSFGLGKYEVK